MLLQYLIKSFRVIVTKSYVRKTRTFYDYYTLVNITHNYHCYFILNERKIGMHNTGSSRFDSVFAVNNSDNNIVLMDSKSERLILLKVSQSTFGGNLACAVCVCYLSVYLHNIKSIITPWQVEEIIKQGAEDWKDQQSYIGSVALQDPVIAKKFSRFLYDHLVVVKEISGLMNVGTFREKTSFEKQNDLYTLRELVTILNDYSNGENTESISYLDNKSHKENENEKEPKMVTVAFCKGVSGAYTFFKILGGKYYMMIDSHSYAIPSEYSIIPVEETGGGGFIYETRFEDQFLTAILRRYGGEVSDERIFELETDFAELKSPSDNWSSTSIQPYQYSAFILDTFK